MKGKNQCFGLLLLLFIMVGLSLSVSLDTNATSHEYMGIPYFNFVVPTTNGSTLNTTYNSETGKYEADWDYSHASSYIPANGFGGFSIIFDGDSFEDQYFSDIALNYDSSFMDTDPYYDPGEAFSSFNYLGFSPLLSKTGFSSGFSISSSDNTHDIFPSLVSNLPAWLSTRSLTPFTQKPFSTSDLSTLDNVNYDWLTGNFKSHGANEVSYYQKNIQPLNFSASGFYIRSHAIDTSSGMHYNHSFSFQGDLFNKEIHRFSGLQLPLWDYSDYFFDSSNLYKDRQVEFKGVFEFDGSFAWHSNFENDGIFKVILQGLDSDTGQNVSQDIPCTLTNRVVPALSVNWLEYSCSGFYDYDYIYLQPVLWISGNEESTQYVWDTNANWRFSGLFLVTDNDDTPGTPFNDNLPGGGVIPGYALNDVSSDDPDFFQSLANLFQFTFINPFTPLFSMFVDNTSCVRIPTIASMLYVADDEVCPFFDSNVRSILTPVFTLSSMMLIFGFAVRWLGARSGNLFEDSLDETIGRHSSLNNGWGRRGK